jgi:hypothetical protein
LSPVARSRVLAGEEVSRRRAPGRIRTCAPFPAYDHLGPTADAPDVAADLLHRLVRELVVTEPATRIAEPDSVDGACR